MKYPNLLFPVMFAVILLSACCGGKECPEYESVLRSGIELVNFTAGQVDSVQIKEYRAGTNFIVLLDSIGYMSYLFDSINSTYNIEFDSTLVGVPDSAINFLVNFPSAGLTYKITNITSKTVICSKCLGHIEYGGYTSGYILNDSLHTNNNNPVLVVIQR